MAKVAELPLDQMLEDLRKTLESTRALVDSEDLRGALQGARRAGHAAGPALDELRAAAKDARGLVSTLERRVEGTGTEVSEAVAELRRATARAERAMGTLEATLEGAEETRVAAALALEELTRTMKAMRGLAEYVQTHPEAVVLGKPKAEEGQ
jgi:methyl-accepting chemotaxis protein